MTITRLGWESGTAAEWTSANPVLRKGQPGWETDTQTGKVGDGSTAWSSLPYVIGVTSGGGGIDTSAIHAAPSKTTPVDADELVLLNSADSFNLWKLTYANLKAGIAAFIASAGQTLTNKNLASGSNVFPVFNQDTTGTAGTATRLATPRGINGVPFDGSQAVTVFDATKVPTSRAVAGHPLTADVNIGFSDLVTGVIDDDQQRPGAVIRAFCDDGINWLDMLGNVLTARPSSNSAVSVEYIDTTPTGAAPIPAWALANRDTMGQANGAGGGGGGPSPLLVWYGTGLANAHSIVAADAGSGDSPAVATTGGTPTPTIVTGGAFSPAVSFAQAAAQVCNLHFTIGSTNPQGRARFFFQTPAAWYASSQTLFRFTDASDALLCGLTLRGSGTPGALSLNDTTGANAGGTGTTPLNTLAVSTWYRVEPVLDQSGVIARMYLFNTSGALVYDSGNVTGLSLGTAGTWAKAVWGPTVSSVTTAVKMANLKIMSDPATAVGPA